MDVESGDDGRGEDRQDDEDSSTTDSFYDGVYDKIDFGVPRYYRPHMTPYVTLRGRQLQVIVKLAEIRLTPDTPSYEGGNRHIEGMSNEQIVATVVHYYDSEKVTHAGLEFRSAIDGYEAISPKRSVHHQCWQDGAKRGEEFWWGDEKANASAYGLAEGNECNQDLGFLTTFGGRSIAFPNLYQHRVGPMKLIDKTKPGHRRILVFWLVHPFQRVTSTATVPPQQSSWFDENDSAWRRMIGLNADRLTTDLRRNILSFLDDWPMSHEAARAYREKLITERTCRSDDDYTPFSHTFSFCEH